MAIDYNKRRKVHTRATALRSVGKSDEQILDSILGFTDISDGLRSKIKSAKSEGRSKQALDDLISQTGQGIETSTVQKDEFEGEGKVAGVARFLGIEKAGRRIGAGLAQFDPQHKRNLAQLSEEEQQTIKTGGVSGKEFAGSLGNVALSLAGGSILKGGAKALGAKATKGGFKPVLGTGARALNDVQKGQRTLGTLAKGAGVGYASDVAQSMTDDENLSRVLTPGFGTLTGGLIGGIPGAKKLITGRGAKVAKKEMDSVVKKITPDVKELTPSEFEDLLNKGRITPRTKFKPSEMVLSDKELATVARNPELIHKDPVKTVSAINERIAGLDNEVGQFLTTNNGIFNKAQLSNAIKNGMKDVTDIAVDETRINKAKDQLLKNFMTTIEKNDMHSLWQARKVFDQNIESAFKGSPTLQKEMRIAFRNSIQDFVGDNTPNSTYKTLMKDMSNLFNVRDLADISAGKQKNYSQVQQVFRNYPTLKWLAGSAAAGAAGAIGIRATGGIGAGGALIDSTD